MPYVASKFSEIFILQFLLPITFKKCPQIWLAKTEKKPLKTAECL